MEINIVYFFFFNNAATTEIYTLSLHNALPFSALLIRSAALAPTACPCQPPQALGGINHDPGTASRGSRGPGADVARPDRKSTRLNSSHANISYAVFCLKKKKIYIRTT